MSEASKVAVLAEHVERRRLASKAGSIIDCWTRACPFMGCTQQHISPCEVTIRGPDGSNTIESWYAVACACDAYGQPGRTEREALDNWNRRT